MESHITISRSAEVIASIDGLLMEILLRLPSKSLMRFKLVSKEWKSLITSPHFSLLRNPGPIPPIGLFYPLNKRSQFEYIHFDVRNPTNPTFRQLRFPYDPSSYWIHQSCHGLFLCCSSGTIESPCHRSPIRKSYIYNPTTGCFKKLPRPGIVNDVPRIVHSVNLAFDHKKSPPYKVVCVRGSETARELYQIEMYEPECGSWRVSGKPFRGNVNFDHGVYWNGSVNWISCLLGENDGNELLYFNVDEERMGRMQIRWGRIVYFGESGDHLHIVENFGTEVAFDVCEIKRDYSGWFVKYRVDLTLVASTFPDMAHTNVLENRIFYAFSVLSLVRSDEGGSFMVLQVSRKVIKLNLEDNTFHEIGDFGGRVVERPFGWPFLLPGAFEYFESLACV